MTKCNMECVRVRFALQTSKPGGTVTTSLLSQGQACSEDVRGSQRTQKTHASTMRLHVLQSLSMHVSALML